MVLAISNSRNKHHSAFVKVVKKYISLKHMVKNEEKYELGSIIPQQFNLIEGGEIAQTRFSAKDMRFFIPNSRFFSGSKLFSLEADIAQDSGIDQLPKFSPCNLNGFSNFQGKCFAWKKFPSYEDKKNPVYDNKLIIITNCPNNEALTKANLCTGEPIFPKHLKLYSKYDDYFNLENKHFGRNAVFTFERIPLNGETFDVLGVYFVTYHRKKRPQ